MGLCSRGLMTEPWLQRADRELREHYKISLMFVFILLSFSFIGFFAGFAWGEAHGWTGCISYGLGYLEKAGFVLPPDIIEKLGKVIPHGS